MRVFSSSLMFKQNNIASQRGSESELDRNRQQQQHTASPHIPLVSPNPHCTILSALHGVCILLLITKASEEFKFKFEFQFQFEFHFFSFRFSSLGLFLFSFCFVSFGRQHRKRTIKPNAKRRKEIEKEKWPKMFAVILRVSRSEEERLALQFEQRISKGYSTYPTYIYINRKQQINK